MTWRVAGLGVGVILGVVAVSCGGGSDGGGGSSSAPAAGGVKVDACLIVTREEATALFGQPASPQKGSPVLDPNLAGECLWTWDTEEANQLLQLRVWNGARYHGEPPPDSQPIDIGEKGFVRVHRVAGVDVEWVQKDKTVSLSYSTVGKGVPDPQTKAEEVKTLARKVAAQL